MVDVRTISSICSTTGKQINSYVVLRKFTQLVHIMHKRTMNNICCSNCCCSQVQYIDSKHWEENRRHGSRVLFTNLFQVSVVQIVTSARPLVRLLGPISRSEPSQSRTCSAFRRPSEVTAQRFDVCMHACVHTFVALLWSWWF